MSVKRVPRASGFTSHNVRSTSGYEHRLIGHWIGRENGLMLRDRSQYARHGILTNGPIWTAPRLASDQPALLMDYTDDHAIASRRFLGPVAFPASMAAWSYWDGTQSGNDKWAILHTDLRNGPGNQIGGYGLRLWGAVGNNIGLDSPNGGQSLYYSTMQASSGRWFFWGFSCQGNSGDAVNLYLDQQTTTAQTTWQANSYLPNGPTDFCLDVAIGPKWPGMIGECLFWDRALTTAEMLELSDPTFSPANIRPIRKYFVGGGAPPPTTDKVGSMLIMFQ